MPDRVHYHPNLIYSPGTQVVTLVEILRQNGKVLHPRGSVGVVVRSPADMDHPYRVRFADGIEDSLNRDQLTMLARYKESEIGVHPSDVASIFERLSDHKSIIILDEFDRVSDEATKRAMADLIKNISDNIPLVKLILVGVGSSITDLIGQHPSISRNLVEIEVPIMSTEEIIEILKKGCNALSILASDSVYSQAALLSNGFPHYAHHLGLCIAKACATQETTTIDDRMFNELACSFAVEDALEEFRAAYSRATKTTQSSRYPLIFCSCAHADHDENGVFRSSDVVEAMKRVFKETVSLQSVVPALGEFASTNRGPALIKVPHRNRNHYKFCDPMLIPFLHLKTKQLRSAE